MGGNYKANSTPEQWSAKLERGRKYKQGQRAARASATTPETLREQVASLYRGEERTRWLTREMFMELWDEHVKTHGLRCAMSGQPFNMSVKATRPSVDQIIPSAGYWPGNVRFVTFIVNETRSNMSDANFLAMCQGVVKHLKP